MATREKIKLTSYNELLGVNNDMISEIDINKFTHSVWLITKKCLSWLNQ